MLILAADTSTPYLSVSLCDNDEVLAEFTEYADRQHAEKILPVLDSILSETETSLTAIDLFAVSIGPGSFTGLRIGVSAWKGLALGVQAPIIGIPTLDALASRVPSPTGPVCTLLDAKMDEVYACLYTFENGKQIVQFPPIVDSIESVLKRCPANTVFIGDGATKYKSVISEQLPTAEILPDSFDAPSATAVALIAFRLCQNKMPANDNPVSPLYLRKSQAEEVRDAKNASAVST